MLCTENVSGLPTTENPIPEYPTDILMLPCKKWKTLHLLGDRIIFLMEYSAAHLYWSQQNRKAGIWERQKKPTQLLWKRCCLWDGGDTRKMAGKGGGGTLRH